MSKQIKSVGNSVKKVANRPAAMVANPLLAISGRTLGMGAEAASNLIGGKPLAMSEQMNIPGIGLSEEARRQARTADIARGRDFAREVIPSGSLGRLGSQQNIKDSLAQLREGLKGMSSEEMQARRDIAGQATGAATEAARRRLAAAQARSGVRGATAAAQQANIIGQGIQARGNIEQDLMLQNRQLQQQGAQNLLAGQTGISQFDLGQAARERFAELSTSLGFAQLGSAERGGQLGARASVAAAQAQKPSGGILGGVLGK